ncbi:hypothetical protein BJX61DRAFT_515134 [Aspergillus egyptiacus]|nr:hypothetical protein BJX61DRAFT_515134 [Aspergillus egyptiacus]
MSFLLYCQSAINEYLDVVNLVYPTITCSQNPTQAIATIKASRQSTLHNPLTLR